MKKVEKENIAKKLNLSKETLRHLSGEKLIAVHGACWSATTDCDPPLCQDNQASGGC